MDIIKGYSKPKVTGGQLIGYVIAAILVNVIWWGGIIYFGVKLAKAAWGS